MSDGCSDGCGVHGRCQVFGPAKIGYSLNDKYQCEDDNECNSYPCDNNANCKNILPLDQFLQKLAKLPFLSIKTDKKEQISIPTLLTDL